MCSHFIMKRNVSKVRPCVLIQMPTACDWADCSYTLPKSAAPAGTIFGGNEKSLAIHPDGSSGAFQWSPPCVLRMWEYWPTWWIIPSNVYIDTGCSWCYQKPQSRSRWWPPLDDLLLICAMFQIFFTCFSCKWTKCENVNIDRKLRSLFLPCWLWCRMAF